MCYYCYGISGAWNLEPHEVGVEGFPKRRGVNEDNGKSPVAIKSMDR